MDIEQDKGGRLPWSSTPRAKNPNATAKPGDVTEDERQQQGDWGPWTQSPSSSRVASFRYNYTAQSLLLTWRNGRPAFTYLGVPYEVFRSFARIMSKGKAVNSALNGYSYRPASTDELDAPSNEERHPVSRARG